MFGAQGTSKIFPTSTIFSMLDSTAISLLTESSEEERTPMGPTMPSARTSRKAFKAISSDPSISGVSESLSPLGRSCNQRCVEFLSRLSYDQLIGDLLSPQEFLHLSKLFDFLRDNSATARMMGTLLGRQWPKWHSIQIDEESLPFLLILEKMGVILTTAGVRDWHIELNYPIFDPDEFLCKEMQLAKTCSMLDVFILSLPIAHLRKLVHTRAKENISKQTLVHKIKSAYNGKQRTIFGDLNDTNLLLRKVNEMELKETGQNRQYIFLTEEVRAIFLRLVFALDIDTDDERLWNSALPPTILKALANKGIGTLTPRKLFHQGSQSYALGTGLRIYQSKNQVEKTRLLTFLEKRVELRKLCPKLVSSNVRQFMKTIDCSWDSTSGTPEWWWRRQLPRRCSNVLWKCISELERLKFYDVAMDHLTYLIDNNKSLLGQKRRGKVAIRLLVVCGHLGRDIDGFEPQLMSMDLHPADIAELQRRFAGVSLNKYEWPCGSINERTVEIYGASSRDFNWVEKAALEHYYLDQSQGGFEQGLHCEGRVMMEIFNTFFNHVLCDMSTEGGVFQSPLQRWSLDVGYLSRDPKRWSQVEFVLSEIELLKYEALSELYRARATGLSEYPIESILNCMQGSILAGILKQIASDPFYWSGGQPDLLVWNSRTKRVMFAEVKGPGDHLSPRQRWWLAHLMSVGAEAEVCYVVDERTTHHERKNGKRIKTTKSKVKTPIQSIKKDIELIELD